MTERDFCYWLQGFFEINGKNKALSAKQTEMIKEHLDLVFTKVTASGGLLSDFTPYLFTAGPPVSC